jgi:maltooligosyltrehalose trehalohydrolase
LPAWQLLGYAQNHDQCGNRAQGDRLAHVVGPGRLKIAAALVLTAPFVPMLFQGEEWAASSPFQYFTSHTDPALGQAVSEGRRGEFADFGWSPDEVPDPQDPATFERSKLRWEEVTGGHHAELLRWHRALIALRRSTPDLLDGRLDRVRTSLAEAAGTLVVERGSITLALNLGVDPATLDLPGETVLASEPAATAASLPPDSVVILRAR